MQGRRSGHRSARRRCLTGLQTALVLALASAVAACSSSSGGPQPARSSAATPTPSPTEPKPGGTLRIAGVSRTIDLDPASPASEPDGYASLTAVSRADGDRMIGRLVLRQLYGYLPTDPTQPAAGGTVLSGPVPDLASGGPKLSDDGRTAAIQLRAASWDVPSGRRVTATDELRALKRLCLPNISSPVRGYLTESIVGFAAACSRLRSDPPKTLADLDAVDIPGLVTQGDNTLVLHLLQPTNDITAIFALPETSPLPVESFTGLQVTNNAQEFVGDGPYSFVQPQAGETYALSRSQSWDPSSDPLRHAYVDHISIRGGMTPARVLQLVSTGGADLSLDVSVPPASAATAAPDAVVRTPALSLALLAIGDRGFNAGRLTVPRDRQVIAACIDAGTRARVAAALGTGLATATGDLLGATSLVPSGQRSPAPSPSASDAASPTPTQSSAPATTRAPAASPEPSPSASPSPPVRCVRTPQLTGSTLSLLTVDTPTQLAAAAVIVRRLAVIGVRVVVVPANSTQFATLARRGGWDLALAVRPVRYPAPRALLAPLLDASWPGTDSLAVPRPAAYTKQLLAAAGLDDTAAALRAWDALQATLANAAEFVALAQVSAVYPRGPNVAQAPTVPTLSNADPANVSLGSTRPGEPSRTPPATP